MNEATITPDEMEHIRTELDKGLEWIDANFIASSESSRATKRLLALDAEEEPIGGKSVDEGASPGA